MSVAKPNGPTVPGGTLTPSVPIAQGPAVASVSLQSIVMNCAASPPTVTVYVAWFDAAGNQIGGQAKDHAMPPAQAVAAISAVLSNDAAGLNAFLKTVYGAGSVA